MMKRETSHTMQQLSTSPAPNALHLALITRSEHIESNKQLDRIRHVNFLRSVRKPSWWTLYLNF